MDGQWLDVEDSAEIRQGDVIRRSGASDGTDELGFVITADCDIAQKKAGERFTFVEIVPASRYLEDFWSPEQLRRLVERQCKAAAEQLSAVMKRSELSVSGISAATLSMWLSQQSANDVAKALNKTGKPLDAKLMKSMEALRFALDANEMPNLERFKSARVALGDDASKVREAMRTAFEGERGFPDYFLLPDIPGTEGVGYVILLRNFASLSSSDIFQSELDARIADRPAAFHRIGRLSDNLRFAVMQKLAFLFMRIGLSRTFEDSCTSASQLIAENMMSGELS